MSGSRPLIYSDLRRWGVIEANTLDLFPLLPEASLDCVVTDPPYGIDFGGMSWDGKQMREIAGSRGSGMSKNEAFEFFSYAWAADALRALKPGGHLISFCAPRTVHRLTTAIEEAGFEIRDQLLWMYSSGMPKSRRMEGGRGTALKPAYEPIVLARKKPDGTISRNLELHGTGAMNTEAAAIPEITPSGTVWRWPANVAYSHSPDCKSLACAPDCPKTVMDGASPAAPLSRIFHSTKASRKEREAGLEHLPRREVRIMKLSGPLKPRANVHQTVKPVALMRWLVRLVCPPGGLVFDPFAGSGSTGIAALLEGRQFIGIEKDPEYVVISEARIKHWGTPGTENVA
ncbi:MAG: site-specific DNA-methyltransferase [Solirubrobacterales bacterium]|nr:site-specific DNA-methyltransferase [Solirubrobacterales bacterium]